MTKKDYLEVAQVIRRKRSDYTPPAETSLSPESVRLLETCTLVVDNVARDLADLFAQDNPRFERDRFMISAGVSR
jgi:hypothetical protein